MLSPMLHHKINLNILKYTEISEHISDYSIYKLVINDQKISIKMANIWKLSKIL